jgi:predicted amidohydrolase YtcJ
LLIRGAAITATGSATDAWEPADVRISAGRVREVARTLDILPGESVLEARGGALLPALHDHHIHLFALAAAMESVDCGPPNVNSPEALAAAIQRTSADWVRGVGYHESVAGELDRHALDRLAPGRRVRIQHRTGAAWILSSSALTSLGIDADARDLPDGVERGRGGQPTGRLFRLDDWLRQRLPPRERPSLEAAGRVLARGGVASVTDATPTNDASTMQALERARVAGELRQQVVLMGGPTLPFRTTGPFVRGAVKIILDERALPAPEALAERIEHAHRQRRAVAIHCVTRTELVLALSALESAGAEPTDRLEHASITPPELAEWIGRLGVCVVTQPGFILERGDQYLRDVPVGEQDWLYRCGGLDRAAIPVGAGTDAPYSSPDPWRAIRAAVDRRTAKGRRLGAAEAMTPERALALFTTPHQSPGGRPRRVAIGEPADLMLLDQPWARAREHLERECVAATLAGGAALWSRGPEPPEPA